MRGVARGGLLLLVFTLLSLAYTYPLSLRLADAIALPPGNQRYFSQLDAYLCPWILAAGARGLATAPARLFDANMFHPAPLSLATSENMLGYAPLAAPVFWWTDNAVLSAHVALLGSYVIGGVGMFLLARRFAGAAASLVAALAFVFVPWRLPSVSALPHVATHWLPYIVLAIEAVIASGRRRGFAAVAAAVWANGMTTLNYGVAGFALVPLHALVRLRALRAHPARVVGLAVALLVAAVALVPALWPYLLLSSRGILPPAKPGGRNFAIELLPHLLGAYGIPPVALGVLAAGAALSLFARSRVRQPGWVLGVVLVLFGCILVLGREVRVPGTEIMIPLPLALLERLIPALETLRVPMRFIVVTGLGLALLLGLAVDRLLGLVTGRARAVAAAVVVAVVGAELVWRRAPFDVVPVPIGASTPPVYAYLRQHGAGRPLLELPVGGRRDATRQASAVFFSINHWLPLLNGFASHRPPGYSYLAELIARLPEPAALQQLVSVVDVGWIVVHEADLPVWWPRRAWRSPPPGLRQVARFEDDVLYEVLLRPTEDLREPFRRWYADPLHERFPPRPAAAPGA